MLLYFIIGCCIGSFLCLTAQRIPLGHSIIYPRSHCVKCCRSLSWYELIPILSIIVHSHTLFCSWAILWIFWLQAGVFQWQSVLLTFIVGGVCLRYGQSYLGAGDTLLMLSWSGGLSLEELLQILFLASLFGISVFSVYFICHKKKLEKLPFIPFLSSALLIVLHLRY